jgi:hypothetical protein
MMQNLPAHIDHLVIIVSDLILFVTPFQHLCHLFDDVGITQASIASHAANPKKEFSHVKRSWLWMALVLPQYPSCYSTPVSAFSIVIIFSVNLPNYT